jgi:AcrR family transcriptional regulator
MLTREKILRAALDLFAKDGWDGMTTAAICQRAGVSNGSFFHAYSSKEMLWGDLYIGALTAYHNALIAVLEAALTAEDGVRGIIESHLGWVCTERAQAQLLFEQSRGEWTAPLRERQAQENSRLGEAVRRWHQTYLDSGEIADVDSVMLVAQLIGPAQIFCRAWLSGRSSTDPRQYVPQLTELACKSLLRH